MNDLAHKCMGISGVEVKDPDQGIVRAVIGRTMVKDLDADWFLKGAFGSRAVRVSAYNHRSWPHRGGLPPVGRGTIEEVGNDVIAEMKFFLTTTDGREAFELVREMSDLQEWSFGWFPGHEKLAEVTPELKAKGVRRAIRSVPVAEVSPVMLGASIGTRTVGVKECDEECQCEKAKAESADDAAEADPPPDLKAAIDAEIARYEEITARANVS